MRKFMFLVLMCSALTLWAQNEPNRLPVDKDVRIGHLDNGLTYYIRHNEQPKQRCEFHIAQAVGAVLEEDNQNGLAHFLEHMAFNGTEHFPGKGIIDYFESIGVNFGGNINAYTSIDETVYRLSDVPTVREGIIDSALLVMYDWSCGLSLLPEEIDSERGVIREEWRTRNNANYRLYSRLNAAMYPGSQYGKRDVIGDTAVINNFEYDALRSYYKKWYGPDLQAIVVVGDIDVDQIEEKIKQLWTNVPARRNRGVRPLHTVAYNTEPRIAIVTDKEAQSTRITLEYLHEQLPREMENTDMAYAIGVYHSLISQMMGTRFDEMAKEVNSHFHWAGIGYGETVKLRDAFMASVGPKEGQETLALQDLLAELERMQRYGFTNSELDRAKLNMLNGYENSYNKRNTRDNISFAREYIRNFEDHESIPGIEWELNFVKQLLPTISVELLNSICREYMHENPIVAIAGQEKDGVKIPNKEQILSMLGGMKTLQLDAPKEEVIDTKLVKKAPKAGKIKKQAMGEAFGTTEWTLSNGIKVIIKSTKFKDDEITLQAYSKGGTSLIEMSDMASAVLATEIVNNMGYGDFSNMQLRKALTGKSAHASPSIGSLSEEIWGGSNVKDFETMLQLMYLVFTSPRRDEEAYKSYMARLSDGLASRDKNPKTIFNDSVRLMNSNHSNRTFILTKDKLDQVSLDKALEIYRQRFANPGDFTFLIIGDINPEDKSVRDAVCQWIGGLKVTRQKENYKDRQVRMPKGLLKNYFSREMLTHTATNRIQYSSYDIPYTLDNCLNMEIIGRILSTRYLESIREREGGSYGVGCGGWMNRLPVPSAQLVMQFDTDPEKQEKLMAIIHEEVKTIINNGPLEKDLKKEKESMLKDYQENLEQNGWWRGAIYNHYEYGENALRDYKNAVERISSESVQTMLTKLVESGNMFEVVMFPDK